jgi:hypothetical protein
MTPLLKSVSIGVGGIAVSVLVYFGAITGGSYQGSILTHLVDLIQGSVTQTTVAVNSPAWSMGIPMQPPIISSVATSSNGSATSGLASSTPYVFQVAAIDSNGGTTTLGLSATITTDASTTQSSPEDLVLKWTPVNGATGYAIFFGTSTAVGSGLTQYFYATTSGQFTFSTSTGSLPGSFTINDSTAFSELINPLGTEVFNDSINNATSSRPASTTAMQINGTAVMSASATTTACESDTAGAVFFNTANKHEWGCDGTTWNKIF